MLPIPELVHLKPQSNISMVLPPRLSLRYHPLFLELGRHIQKKTWGSLRGAHILGTVIDRLQAAELVALFSYIFGLPEHHRINYQGSLIHVVLLYPAAASELLFTVLPSGIAKTSLWGSLSFDQVQMVEFRFGQDCFIAHTSKEGHMYHLALPEGTPEEYRALDIQRGRRVLSWDLENQVDNFIKSLTL